MNKFFSSKLYIVDQTPPTESLLTVEDRLFYIKSTGVLRIVKNGELAPVRVSEGNKKCLIAGNLNSIIVRSGADNNLICGENNQVAGSNQIVTGQYSLPDASGALIIGNGTEERDRKNSLVIKKDGTIVVPVYDSTGTNQTGEFAVLKVVKASNGSLSIKAFKN